MLDTELGKLGGLLCWEHWMPLTRQAMHEQTELLHVACWPDVKEMPTRSPRATMPSKGEPSSWRSALILRKRDLAADLALLQEIPGEPDELIQRGGSGHHRARMVNILPGRSGTRRRSHC